MSITATFYQNFTKNKLSTRQPVSGSPWYTGTWTTSILLKMPCGVKTPRIEVRFDSITDSPHQWNYCFIPSFGRYYYVTEWTAELGYWVADLTTDLMATYKGDIGNSRLFIERSASVKNGSVTDNLYPMTTCDFGFNRIDGIYSTDTSKWLIVVAVISGGGSIESNGLRYYGFTREAFNEFKSILFTTSQSNFLTTYDFNTDYLNVQTARLIFNPAEYIAGIWIYYGVFSSFEGLSTQEIKIGFWDINLQSNSAVNLTGSNLHKAKNGSFTLAKHPSTAAYGEYMNYAPYTSHILHMPPFNDFALEYGATVGLTSFRWQVDVDLMSGGGILKIWNGAIGESECIASKTGQIGQPIALAGVDINAGNISLNSIIGTGGSTAANATMRTADAISNSVINLIKGRSANIAGEFENSFSGFGETVMSTAQEFLGTATASGTGQMNLSLVYDIPCIRSCFRHTTEHYPDEHGYPTYQVLRVGDLSGFVKTIGASLNMSGLAGERETIESILNSGFYYE